MSRLELQIHELIKVDRLAVVVDSYHEYPVSCQRKIPVFPSRAPIMSNVVYRVASLESEGAS